MPRAGSGGISSDIHFHRLRHAARELNSPSRRNSSQNGPEELRDFISLKNPRPMPLWCRLGTPENFSMEVRRKRLRNRAMRVCRPSGAEFGWNASSTLRLRHGLRACSFGPRYQEVCREQRVQIQAGVIEAAFCLGGQRVNKLESRDSRRNPSTSSVRTRRRFRHDASRIWKANSFCCSSRRQHKRLNGAKRSKPSGWMTFFFLETNGREVRCH